MRSYDPTLPLISLHIPKTAGTSLRTTLTEWFGTPQVLFHYRGAQGEAPTRFELQAGQCVHGHFNRVRGIGALDYYPQARQFVTFLRDPFARFISQWRYLHFQQRMGVAVPALDDNPSFADWFERRAQAMAAGDDPFSFLAQLPWPVPADNPASVFDIDYVAVGIMEDYDASVRVLAAALGFPAPLATVHINRADDPHRNGDPTADFPEWREPHREAFAIEYAVYEAGRARMLEALAKLS
jgi:hypothetical protein